MPSPSIASARFFPNLTGYIPLTIFLGVLVYISLNAPNFVTMRNLELILMQSLPVVLVCAGLAAVGLTHCGVTRVWAVPWASC